MNIKFDSRQPGNIQKEAKIILYPTGKFYLFPHYMSCMSWSPDRGQKVYKWMLWVFRVEKKNGNQWFKKLQRYYRLKHPILFLIYLYHRIKSKIRR